MNKNFVINLLKKYLLPFCYFFVILTICYPILEKHSSLTLFLGSRYRIQMDIILLVFSLIAVISNPIINLGLCMTVVLGLFFVNNIVTYCAVVDWLILLCYYKSLRIDDKSHAVCRYSSTAFLIFPLIRKIRNINNPIVIDFIKQFNALPHDQKVYQITDLLFLIFFIFCFNLSFHSKNTLLKKKYKTSSAYDRYHTFYLLCILVSAADFIYILLNAEYITVGGLIVIQAAMIPALYYNDDPVLHLIKNKVSSVAKQ